MELNSSVYDREKTAYPGNYLIIPVVGTFLIVFMLFYLNSEKYTLPSIIPWPDSGIGKSIALVGIYILIFLPILLLCAVAFVVTAFVPRFQPIFQQVRQDWSLMSFLLYGLSPFMVMLNDEYRGLGFYQLVCLMLLLIGAFLYLQPASSWSRLIKLVVTLSLSMIVVGCGMYLLYPQQAWSAHTTFPRWWEAIWPFLVGISLAVTMTIPALLGYLPKGSKI